MRHPLYPDRYEESALKVTPASLIQAGIRGVVLDIDNTLEPYFVPEPGQAVRDWITDLQKAGLKLYIVSNGKEERVERFNRDLNLPYVCHAGKPSAKGFRRAQEELNLPYQELAVIGDQILTDVCGGNRLGMTTILVKQVSRKDEWMTAVKRPLEKIVLYFYRKGL